MKDETTKEFSERVVYRVHDLLTKFVTRWTDVPITERQKLLEEQASLLQMEINMKIDSVRVDYERKRDAQLDRIEMYLEYMFIVSQYTHTEQHAAMIIGQLRQRKGDIQLMAAAERLENDQKMLSPRMFELADILFRGFEEKHGNGKRFKFFNYKNPQSKNGIN